MINACFGPPPLLLLLLLLTLYPSRIEREREFPTLFVYVACLAAHFSPFSTQLVVLLLVVVVSQFGYLINPSIGQLVARLAAWLDSKRCCVTGNSWEIE